MVSSDSVLLNGLRRIRNANLFIFFLKVSEYIHVSVLVYMGWIGWEVTLFLSMGGRRCFEDLILSCK